ncbi:MAG: hypothetical protein K2G85_01935 [Muribaculaceae bacterium]|nr:hypothetical protein [Muribaculaceae bacterium]
MTIFYDNMKENKAKETYVKPESEIVELELEQPILGGSAPNWEDGGTWGF